MLSEDGFNGLNVLSVMTVDLHYDSQSFLLSRYLNMLSSWIYIEARFLSFKQHSGPQQID